MYLRTTNPKTKREFAEIAQKEAHSYKYVPSASVCVCVHIAIKADGEYQESDNNRNASDKTFWGRQKFQHSNFFLIYLILFSFHKLSVQMRVSFCN